MNLLVFNPLFIFPVLALAHHITSIPEPSQVALALQRRQTSLDFSAISSALACQEDASGCAAQLTLYDACKAEYGTDYYYLYCLCTTGYYKAMHDCDLCSVTRGALGSATYDQEVSADNSRCSSKSTYYASLQSTPATATGSKGPLSAVTTTHSTGPTTVRTSDMLGGLIGTPTLPIQPASTSATINSAPGHHGVAPYTIFLSIIAWVIAVPVL